MTNNWEHEFWQMVEEKGVGSDVRFAQACRDFIKEQLTFAEKRGEEKSRGEMITKLKQKKFTDKEINKASKHRQHNMIFFNGFIEAAISSLKQSQERR